MGRTRVSSKLMGTWSKIRGKWMMNRNYDRGNGIVVIVIRVMLSYVIIFMCYILYICYYIFQEGFELIKLNRRVIIF